MSEKKEKKKREYKGRYSYLNDFKLNDANEYEYQGNVFELEQKEAEYKPLFQRVFLYLIGNIVMLLVAGFVPFQGMVGAFYVFIPYVLEILFLGLLFNAFLVMRESAVIREYKYNKSYKRVQLYGGALMGNHIFAFATAVIFILIKGADPILFSLVYLCTKVVSFYLTKEITQKLLSLTYKQIQFKKTGEEN